jgi:hypothetical protein
LKSENGLFYRSILPVIVLRTPSAPRGNSARGSASPRLGSFMIRRTAVAPVDLDRPESFGSLSIRAALHHLELHDVFEFVDKQIQPSGAAETKLPTGRLRIIIKPWGPKTPRTGPIGPWMFACRDAHGIERHFALPPQLEVRLLERARK